MAYDVVFRKRIFRETLKHEISGAPLWEDTGWNLIMYPEGGAALEPRDYVPITGVSNNPGKRNTEIVFWGREDLIPSINHGVAGLLQPAFT
mgnify:CR=1 FL=1|tara:strand:- start:1541 stop:1813 length:273 start_codon:yes stop_codon:yes gene_type:complete